MFGRRVGFWVMVSRFLYYLCPSRSSFFGVIDTDGEQLVFGLIERTNDEMFLAKFTEASGNPRDFVWKGLLGSFET